MKWADDPRTMGKHRDVDAICREYGHVFRHFLSNHGVHNWVCDRCDRWFLPNNYCHDPDHQQSYYDLDKLKYHSGYSEMKRARERA